MNVAIKFALQSAVQHKAVCQVKLRTEPNPRHVHPHGLMLSAQGKHYLICWQDDGHSKTGNFPNFRTLPIDDVTALEITDDQFSVQEKFNADHKMYRNWQFVVTK